MEEIERRLREVEMLLASHRDSIASIPDLRGALTDLRLEMKGLATTIKIASGIGSFLIAAIEVAHILMH
jgi:hypothetical protein